MHRCSTALIAAATLALMATQASAGHNEPVTGLQLQGAPATSTQLGAVKPDGTTITNNGGAVSTTYGTGANTATQGNDTRLPANLGTAGTPVIPMRAGAGSTDAAATAAAVNAALGYTATPNTQAATSSVLGLVRPDGSTTTISGTGVLSITSMNISNALGAPPLLVTGGTVTGVAAFTGGAPTNWASTTNGYYDGTRHVLSNGVGFPLTGEFAYGTQAIAQATVGAINIPTGTNLYQGHGLAGYALNNAAANNYSVGVYGQATFGSNGTSPVGQINSGSGDAVNGACSNGPTQQVPSTSSPGNSPGAIACVESDTNIGPVNSSGAGPFSNVYGLQVAGGSTVQPVGDFISLHIAAPGTVAWKKAIVTDNGAAGTGLSLGQLLTTTSAASQSQAIVLNARLANGTAVTGQAYIDANGNFIHINGANGALFSFIDASGASPHDLDLSPSLASFAGAVTAGGNLNGPYLKLTPQTFATVQSQRPCNSSNAGTVAIISDSTVTAPNSTVAGGGGNTATIMCNPAGTGYVAIGG